MALQKRYTVLQTRRTKSGHGRLNQCEVSRKLPRTQRKRRDLLRAEKHRYDKAIKEHQRLNRLAARKIVWLKDTERYE